MLLAVRIWDLFVATGAVSDNDRNASGGFLKWGYLQIIQFIDGFSMKKKHPSLGIPHLWNPPKLVGGLDRL
jgi:hypothetical protein